MNGDIDIVHHPGLIAENIDDAVGQFERLGFVFTPLSLARITLTPGEAPGSYLWDHPFCCSAVSFERMTSASSALDGGNSPDFHCVRCLDGSDGWITSKTE
jgi:hypothetical protein